ncbi:MAG TPA: SpoIID/LytB domain-containing protein [Jatrophihabitans sp.]|nr:SpoIID/LytB domain-containing protein [Jatrophihabitans sp.]
MAVAGSTARRRTAAAVGALAAGAAVLVAQSPAAHAETLTLPKTAKTFVIEMRGNGHGHGMSQYGARGAAIAGKTYRQILAFYYPKAILTRINRPRIRVLLSNTGTTTTIAATSNVVLTGYPGTLPTAGIARYRLVAGAGSGLVLQKLGTAAGSTWTPVRISLADGTGFQQADFGALQLFLHDGTSTSYYGSLMAWRQHPRGTAGGVYTVDAVNWNRYAQGVVPREMPSSWQRAAVDAQAVAARTYGANAAANPMSSTYDICDTTWCQVYGGYQHLDARGNVLWQDFPSAATDTSNQILSLDGQPIFAQFSASNGGWTVSGGQPYLIAQADPYDNAASGDPYLDYKRTVTVASVASAFGLKTLTKISITKRDGHGAWGGRVLNVTLTGTDTSNKATTVTTSGNSFAGAIGLGTSWLRLLAS